MTKHEEMQAYVRYYKRINNKTAVSMAEVSVAAIADGWPEPPPLTGVERLAKSFSDAEREEIRHDQKTKRPYRANLAITERLKDGKQRALWVDTDEADRDQMEMAMAKYRDQMIGEAVIGTNTVDHWNRMHPDQIPLPFDTDLKDEVQWRLNAPPDEDEKAS
ncbi:MAG TPA: hypothetical protein VIH89_17435 [Candidatus Sulfotelmatobacter sp.]|jgi:hypothetical protein